MKHVYLHLHIGVMNYESYISRNKGLSSQTLTTITVWVRILLSVHIARRFARNIQYEYVGIRQDNELRCDRLTVTDSKSYTYNAFESFSRLS